MGDDIDEAQKAALEIGATRLPHEGPDFRVYADPVGHPFCLCRHERIGLSTLDAQPSGALARYR